jgi:CRP/FNR family transcriptional regulator
MKTKGEPGPVLGSLAGAPALQAFPAALLAPHATVLRTRPRQALPLTSDRGETAFIVGAGTLSVQVTLPGTPCQAVALLFPGDMFRSSFAPPGAKAALVSAARAEVWRLRMSTLEGLAGGEPSLARCLDQALVSQMARRAIHAVMLGQFDCEQRVATFLVELALRIGTQLPGGVAFDIPLARTDAAFYLGLNPDTLSRVMSRLRAKGIFSREGRSQITLRDFRALAALTPAAQALAEIHGDRIALSRRAGAAR